MPLNIKCIPPDKVKSILELNAHKKLLSEYHFITPQDISVEIRNNDQLNQVLNSLKKNDRFEIESEPLKSWLGNVAVKLLFFDENNNYIRSYTVYLKTTVFSEFWIAKENLEEGVIIRQNDLDKVKKNLYDITKASVPTSVDIVGKQVRIKILENELVRDWKLTKKLVVKKGDKLVLKKTNGSITIQIKGEALEDGFIGKKISIRLPNGKIVVGRIHNQSVVLLE